MSSPQTETILVVDDEVPVLNLCTDILRMGGYEVIGAHSGEEALQLLGQGGDGVQLALLDIMMPGLNGVETARRIQTTSPATRVVLMSGYNGADVAKLIGEDSSIPIIWKPFRAKSLLRMVENVLNTPSAEEVAEHAAAAGAPLS